MIKWTLRQIHEIRYKLPIKILFEFEAIHIYHLCLASTILLTANDWIEMLFEATAKIKMADMML